MNQTIHRIPTDETTRSVDTATQTAFVHGTWLVAESDPASLAADLPAAEAFLTGLDTAGRAVARSFLDGVCAALAQTRRAAA